MKYTVIKPSASDVPTERAFVGRYNIIEEDPCLARISTGVPCGGQPKISPSPAIALSLK